MAGEMDKPTKPIEVVDGEERGPNVKTPNGFDVRDAAMALVNHQPDVMGAILVIMDTSGTLRVGFALCNNEVVKKTLGGVAQCIKDHCDNELDGPAAVKTGAFSDDKDRN